MSTQDLELIRRWTMAKLARKASFDPHQEPYTSLKETLDAILNHRRAHQSQDLDVNPPGAVPLGLPSMMGFPIPSQG